MSKSGLLNRIEQLKDLISQLEDKYYDLSEIEISEEYYDRKDNLDNILELILIELGDWLKCLIYWI